MASDAENLFWSIRRLLGVRDFDNAPDADRAIRDELELYSIAKGEVSIRRIRARLQLPDDGRWR